MYEETLILLPVNNDHSVHRAKCRTPEGRVPQGFAAENPGKVGSKDRNKPDEFQWIGLRENLQETIDFPIK